MNKPWPNKYLCLLMACIPHLGLSFGWNQVAHKLAKSYRPAVTHSFSHTLWGECNEPLVKTSWIKNRFSKKKSSNKILDSGLLTYYLGLQRNPDGNPHQAPVAIFIPGAFNNLDSKMNKSYMKMFYRLGYHVMALPNPWSIDYIRSRPRFKTGHITSEIKASYLAIKDVIEVLKRKKLVRHNIVRIAGVSYGAFIAAGVMDLDSRNQQFLKNGDATLFSPPYDLGRTTDKLDDYINKNTHLINNKSALFTLKDWYDYFCSIDEDKNISRENKLFAEALSTVVGFQWATAYSVSEYYTVWGLPGVPSQNLKDKLMLTTDSPFHYWKKGLRMGEYIRQMAPSNRELVYGEKGLLFTYLERARAKGFDNYRILTSEDDFLNDPGVWDGHQSVLLLNHGGHYGYRANPWFLQFKYTIFNIISKLNQIDGH